MSFDPRNFFKIADKQYCASTKCKHECKKNPNCFYYSTEDPTSLYKRKPSDPSSSDDNGGSDNKLPVLNLLDSIKELQSVEEYLFQRLEKINRDDPDNINEQNNIINHINELTDLRNNLFQQLQQIYTSLSKHSEIENTNVIQQLTLSIIVEKELNRLKKDTERLQNAKNAKLRMVQIGQYEYLRYSAHTQLMKTVAFTCLALLFASVIIRSIGLTLPPLADKGIIFFIVCAGGVIFLQQLYDIMTRDNMNYSQYDMDDGMKLGHGNDRYESVWEHNKKFFQSLLRRGLREERKLEGEIAGSFTDYRNRIEDDMRNAGMFGNENGNAYTSNDVFHQCLQELLSQKHDFEKQFGPFDIITIIDNNKLATRSLLS